MKIEIDIDDLSQRQKEDLLILKEIFEGVLKGELEVSEWVKSSSDNYQHISKIVLSTTDNVLL